MHILGATLELASQYYKNGKRISTNQAAFCASVTGLNCDLPTDLWWSDIHSTLYASITPAIAGLKERDGLEILFDALNRYSNMDYLGNFSPRISSGESKPVLPIYDAQVRIPYKGISTRDLWIFLDDCVTRAGMGALAFGAARGMKGRYPSPATIELLFLSPGKYMQ